MDLREHVSRALCWHDRACEGECESPADCHQWEDGWGSYADAAIAAVREHDATEGLTLIRIRRQEAVPFEIEEQ